ncbi:YegJ family protein [Haloferula sp.]|uniref:YegJ family protein n=1 Tax=Haloferula sp. TaxID=2497595 RepID=UPI00329DF020
MTSCDDSSEPQESEPQIASVAADDAEMEAAMARARDTFPEFWAEVSEDYQRVIPALTLAQLKAYFHDEDDSESGEHMWVGEVSFDGEMISGTLMSQPGHLDSISEGDSVEFPVSRISDWLIVDDGSAKGLYTVQVLRARMGEDERAAHDANYPFEFPPLNQ